MPTMVGVPAGTAAPAAAAGTKKRRLSRLWQRGSAGAPAAADAEAEGAAASGSAASAAASCGESDAAVSVVATRSTATVKIVKGSGGFGMGLGKDGTLEVVVKGSSAESAGVRSLIGQRMVRATSGASREAGPASANSSFSSQADAFAEADVVAKLSTFGAGECVTFTFSLEAALDLAGPGSPEAVYTTVSPLDSPEEEPAEASPVHTEREQRLEAVFGHILTHTPDLHIGATRNEGLRALSWKGVPPRYRAVIWRYLTYYTAPTADEGDKDQQKKVVYKGWVAAYVKTDGLLEEEEELRHQVTIDVKRMQPGVPLYRNARVQEVCVRVLFLWGIRHPASGYVQGMDALLSPFVAVFLSEQFGRDLLACGADELDMLIKDGERLATAETHCYYALSALLARVQDFYTPSQPGVQALALRVETLTRLVDPQLHAHIKAVGAEYLRDFMWRWATCFLVCWTKHSRSFWRTRFLHTGA